EEFVDDEAWALDLGARNRGAAVRRRPRPRRRRLGRRRWRLARWRVAPDAARNRLDLVVGERGLATATVDFEQRGENLARQHPPVTHRAREGGELVVALPGRDDLLDGRGGAVGVLAPPGACAREEPRGHRRERRFEERMLDLVGIHAA